MGSVRVQSSDIVNAGRVCTEAARAAFGASGGWEFWVDLAATPVVLAVAAALAWRAQLNILARKTANDYISQFELSRAWARVASRAINILKEHDDAKGWEQLASHWSQSVENKDAYEDGEEKKVAEVLAWLDRREFVAASILSKSFHMKTYADWWGENLVKEWARAKPFVEALRATRRGKGMMPEGEPSPYFRKFQKLAEGRRYRRYCGLGPYEGTRNVEGK